MHRFGLWLLLCTLYAPALCAQNYWAPGSQAFAPAWRANPAAVAAPGGDVFLMGEDWHYYRFTAPYGFGQETGIAQAGGRWGFAGLPFGVGLKGGISIYNVEEYEKNLYEAGGSRCFIQAPVAVRLGTRRAGRFVAIGIEPGYAQFYNQFMTQFPQECGLPYRPDGIYYEESSHGFTLGLGMHLQRPRWFFQAGLPLALVLGGDAAEGYYQYNLEQFSTLQLGGGATIAADKWTLEPRAQLLVMPRVDLYDAQTRAWEILYQSTLTLQAHWRSLVLVAGGGTLWDAAGPVGGLGFRTGRFQLLATARRDWGGHNGFALDLALSFRLGTVIRFQIEPEINHPIDNQGSFTR